MQTAEGVSVSQFSTGPLSTAPAQVRPSADLYTVLLILATALLAAGTVFVAVRTQQMFGSLLPPAGG